MTKKKKKKVLSKFMILCWPHSQPSWAACSLWPVGWTPLLAVSTYGFNHCCSLEAQFPEHLLCWVGLFCFVFSWQLLLVARERFA